VDQVLRKRDGLGGADFDGGEGALAAAVADDAVEVEGIEVAPHRGAGGPCRPSSSPAPLYSDRGPCISLAMISLLWTFGSRYQPAADQGK
jgi:hypothetical protein